MATEILAVPEDHLLEVIEIIRRGMNNDTTPEVREALEEWCAEEEDYLTKGVGEMITKLHNMKKLGVE